MHRIESPHNEGLKEIRELTKKAKRRWEKGRFVAEGERLLLDLPTSSLLQLYVQEDYRGALPRGIEKEDSRICILSKKAMESISTTEHGQGILGLLRFPKWKKPEGNLFLILENIQDPGNLGTLFRTAEAAGVSHIFLSRNTVDPFSPKVVRSTMGSLFRLPFSIEEDLLSLCERLKSAKVQVFALDLSGKKAHFQASFQGPSAFLFGNEGNGLTKELSQCATEKLLIPMEGKIESLNVATSASIVLYEAVRQRRYIKEEG